MNISKISIRPVIKTIEKNRHSSVVESFQNGTLRPILKLQNELLIMFFNNYLQNNKLDLGKDKKRNIEFFIKKDTSLKLELRALIVGLFTVDEFKEYLLNSKEINKRIITMMIQRLQDNY